MKEYMMTYVPDFDIQKYNKVFQTLKFTEMCDTVNANFPSNEKTHFCGVFSDDYLYFCYKVQDLQIVSSFTKYNEPLYKEDVVEIFISSDGNFKKYLEYEVSPNNTQFLGEIINDLQFDAHLILRDEFIGDSVAKICDNGYDVVLKIPQSFLGINCKKSDSVYFNAFRINVNFQGDREYHALNPTMQPQFHKPQYFIKMLFNLAK